MNTGSVRVWDPFIRVFHWSVVVLFATAWLTGEEEGWLHNWAGYAILVLIAMRLVWGVIGPRHARFSDFVRSPVAALRYLRGLLGGSARRSLGHNPAGGWMVLVLLVTLLATGASGVIVLGLEGEGPLAGRIEAGSTLVTLVGGAGGEWQAREEEEYEENEHGEQGYEEAGHGESVAPGLEGAEEAWEEIHEFLANLALFLVVVHVLGVLVSSLAHRENLARAMVTGRKRAE